MFHSNITSSFQYIQTDLIPPPPSQVEPPFKPDVTGSEDLSNIDPSFTKIPAGVTPTPAGAAPIETADGQELEFETFTYTCPNVLEDGQEYAVSFADSQDEFDKHK